jgi:hypothetical protein
MLDMIQEFDLVRVGNCKYATAMGEEALFRGVPAMPAYGIEMLT